VNGRSPEGLLQRDHAWQFDVVSSTVSSSVASIGTDVNPEASMSRQPRSLSGRTIAITGGARGIGRATAAAFAQRGARVAIGDIDGDEARATATALGGDVVGFDLDVTDRASFTAFLDAVESRLGPLSVLVNNAGIMPLAALVDERDEVARRQVDINLHGVILGTKLAVRRMVARGDGHIVNIASAAGKAGFPGAATYCATKHAVVGFSEAVRAETHGTGIDLSVVMPSVVNTELAAGLQGTRGVALVEPTDVATAVVEAVEHRRFDVFVPRSLGPLFKLMTVLPRPARELVSRVLKGDKVLAEPDAAIRAAYEARATGPTPTPERDTAHHATAA
jgi:NAD(P)-dependent dehydrogenase (short-subunit alcohol dehydrogenase family)